MATAKLAPAADPSTLIPSFERRLKARNRSPRTIRGYLESTHLFVAFLVEECLPGATGAVERERVEAFIESRFRRSVGAWRLR